MNPIPLPCSALRRFAFRALVAAILPLAPVASSLFAPAAQAMEVGMNLDTVAHYADAYPYSEITRIARIYPALPGGTSTSYTLITDGSVTMPARTGGWPDQYTFSSGGKTYHTSLNWFTSAVPAGTYTYKITGTGTGTALITSRSDSNTVINTQLTANGSSQKGTFYHKGGSDLKLYFSSGAGFQVEIYLPGTYDNTTDTAPLINPQYTSRLADFTVLRFLDWVDANNNTDVVDWSTRRPKATDRLHSGAPIEHIVALANQLQKDIWINIPHLAAGMGANDYVDQTAKVIQYGSDGTNAYTTGAWNDSSKTWKGLDPKLKVYVEYSNEIWNTGFRQGADAHTKGLAKWNEMFPNDPRDNTWANARYFWQAHQSAQIWQKFYDVFPNDARLVRVIAGQATYVAATVRRSLNFLYTPEYNPYPVRAADVVSVAPYMDWNLNTQFRDDFNSNGWSGGIGGWTSSPWTTTASPDAPSLVSIGTSNYAARLDAADAIERSFSLSSNDLSPAQNLRGGVGGYLNVRFGSAGVGDKLYVDFKLGSGQWENFLEFERTSGTQVRFKSRVGSAWSGYTTLDPTSTTSRIVSGFGPDANSAATGAIRIRSAAATGSTGYWEVDDLEILVRPDVNQAVERVGQHIGRLSTAMDELRAELQSKPEYGNLRIALYEGGQHLVGLKNAKADNTLTKTFNDANRNPGMFAVYQNYLDMLESKGVDTLVHYTYAGGYDKDGSWGSMEFLNQTLGDPLNPSSTPNATYKYPALAGWARSTLLLDEQFNNGNYAGWTVAAGNNGWTASSGTHLGFPNYYNYNQNILAYTGSPASANWTDYTLRSVVRPNDRDIWGFLFFYGDVNNHYGVEFTQYRPVGGATTTGLRAHLFKKVGGVVTTLATTTDCAYDKTIDNLLEVSVDSGAKIIVRLNGKQVFSEPTPADRTKGGVAVTTTTCEGILIDSIRVRQHVLTLPLQQN